jgi:hypothetical protein
MLMRIFSFFQAARILLEMWWWNPLLRVPQHSSRIRGGPQDIIFGRNCGFILPFGEMDTWFEHLERCVKLKLESPEEYEMLRKKCV